MQNLYTADLNGALPFRESTADCYQRSVVRVIEAMREQLDQPFTLDSMARIAYFSPFHFNRTFRQVTGIPPCQYLWALRLQAASHLLTETEDTVLNVCYDVGYASLGTFTRRFSEIYGVPPTRFRSLSRAPRQAELFRMALDREAPVVDVPQLLGWIDVPEDFEGAVMIGLFADSIPQGKPAAGCMARRTGEFRIGLIPDGKYYLFALGLPAAGSMFDTAAMPRGGGTPVKVVNGQVTGSTHIRMRAPEATDPPILIAPPVLMERYLEMTAQPQPKAMYAVAGYGD